MTYKRNLMLIKDIWKLVKKFPLQDQRRILLQMLKGITILWDEEGEDWLRDQIRKIQWAPGRIIAARKINKVYSRIFTLPNTSVYMLAKPYDLQLVIPKNDCRLFDENQELRNTRNSPLISTFLTA